jgi:hypothetical protein
MGATVVIRGVELPFEDFMDAIIIDAYRQNDRDIIDGYEFDRYGRRVRNRNPKWRRLDKNTWVKWTGKYARHSDYPSWIVPVLLCVRREGKERYQTGFRGGDWFVDGWRISGWNTSDSKWWTTTNDINVPDAWEICDE